MMQHCSARYTGRYTGHGTRTGGLSSVCLSPSAKYLQYIIYQIILPAPRCGVRPARVDEAGRAGPGCGGAAGAPAARAPLARHPAAERRAGTSE